ncbi:unnamed protein product [Symbiodinium sp. CCMP2456]|nr:unnamed protein product [Symbiodinium sp. CCMP2456]
MVRAAAYFPSPVRQPDRLHSELVASLVVAITVLDLGKILGVVGSNWPYACLHEEWFAADGALVNQIFSHAAGLLTRPYAFMDPSKAFSAWAGRRAAQAKLHFFSKQIALVQMSGKAQVNRTAGELDIRVPGYAEKAGIRRFSMCFNREADGVLGLHTADPSKRLESVGQIHWGVDFHGISIGEGNAKHRVKFCDPKEKRPDQETICGLIPDSGTTMITGPENQLAELYMDICSNWERCQKAFEEVSKEMKDLQDQGMQVGGLSLTQHATVPEELADAFKKLQDILQAGKADASASNSTSSADAADIADILGGGAGAESKPQTQKDYMKANVFLLLLEHCSDWAEGVDMDQELPKLNFHVAGLNGVQTELSLRPKNYIMTATADINVPEMKTLGGLTFQIERKKRGKVCMPAFQPAPFTTKLNGEVWIMGTPLFYEYTAHYDRGSADGKVKPSMAFTHVHEEPCGRCQDNRIVRGGHPALTQKKSEKTGVESLRQLTKAPIVRNLTSTHSL